MNKPLFVQNRVPSRRRGGFTLVELLVVITIIGILAGIAIPAVMAALRAVNKGVVKNDIHQLEAACLAYKAKYGEFPPDGTDADAVTRHVRKVFPHYTGAAPTGLTPFNSLTFWLGGIWDGTKKQFIGFSADPTDPFNPNTASRTAPFFEFDPSRTDWSTASSYIKVGTTDITKAIRYWPPKTDGNKPAGAVAYFRADDGAYLANGKTKRVQDTDSKFVLAAQDSWLTTVAANPIWINPKTFQIFSSGLGGKYGFANPGNTDRINFPSGETKFGGSAYDEETYDDITNFSDGTLEDSMP